MMRTRLLICLVFVVTLVLAASASASNTSQSTCSLDVLTTPGILDVKAVMKWTTFQPEGWHVIEWGDGTDFGFQGLSDDRTESHTYESPDTYTVIFTTDAVDGDEPSCVDEVEVTVPPKEPMSSVVYLPLVLKVSNGEQVVDGLYCRITDEVGGDLHDYTATINWKGAREDWYLMYWGDESQTGAEPPGFFGSEGEKSFPHVYNSGSFVQNATIEDENGKTYTCTNYVTVP